jgi:limonene-1,2-epoxide hydrolase
MSGYDGVEIELRHVVADGPVVLTERVDFMIAPTFTVEIPAMGTLEVRDGKIAEWRDYFDLNQLLSQVPNAPPAEGGLALREAGMLGN